MHLKGALHAQRDADLMVFTQRDTVIGQGTQLNWLFFAFFFSSSVGRFLTSFKDILMHFHAS